MEFNYLTDRRCSICGKMDNEICEVQYDYIESVRICSECAFTAWEILTEEDTDKRRLTGGKE